MSRGSWHTRIKCPAQDDRIPAHEAKEQLRAESWRLGTPGKECSMYLKTKTGIPPWGTSILCDDMLTSPCGKLRRPSASNQFTPSSTGIGWNRSFNGVAFQIKAGHRRRISSTDRYIVLQLHSICPPAMAYIYHALLKPADTTKPRTGPSVEQRPANATASWRPKATGGS